jgi:hypothetical protein
MFRLPSGHFLRSFGATLLVGLACASSSPPSVIAETPATAEVEKWVHQLGDDDYLVRKEAADRLAATGSAARAALARVADGADPEIRSTARRLLTLIDDTEFNRRLSEFASDVDGRHGVTLPGWKEFGELVGRDPTTRALFVEMQREEGPLLARVFDSTPNNFEVAWEEQVGRLFRARSYTQPGELAAPRGSCATLLFLGSLPEMNLSDSGARSLVQMMQLPPIAEALGTPQAKSATRRLIAAWIVNCPNRNDQVLQIRLQTILDRQLTEALPLALKVVEKDPKYLTLSPMHQLWALLAIGRLGSEQHVAAIEPLMEDRGIIPIGQQVTPLGNEVKSIQIRDVALAMALHLTGQEPLTYGFLHANPNPSTVYDLPTLGLETDERRAEALEQWRAWRVQHKLDTPRPASS